MAKTSNTDSFPVSKTSKNGQNFKKWRKLREMAYFENFEKWRKLRKLAARRKGQGRRESQTPWSGAVDALAQSRSLLIPHPQSRSFLSHLPVSRSFLSTCLKLNRLKIGPL